MNEELRHYYLATMGIQAWSPQQTPKNAGDPRCSDASAWHDLQAQVAACQQCALAKTRTQTVFGVGNPQADVMIVGEAPGFNEDRQGEPFVGRAGQLLNKILLTIGLSREQVFIANVLKCRPPANRDPSAEEIQQCTPYLQRQVSLMEPKLIVALGRYAAHYLLKTSESLGALRRRHHAFGKENTPVIVSYHPAYLLRNPADKAKAYVDWQQVAKYVQMA